MKILTRALGIASLLLAAASYHLWYIFASTRPHFSYPEYGQVYAMHANGWTVYLTQTEQMQLYGMAGLAVLCLASAITIDIFAPRQPQNRRDQDRSLR